MYMSHPRAYLNYLNVSDSTSFRSKGLWYTLDYNSWELRVTFS
jgi:hypothetical protein